MMNDEGYVELINAVSNIQDDLCRSEVGGEFFTISMITNTYATIVKFMDILLWSSEDDEREFYESKNEYEPFERYLRRVLKEELGKLKQIKIK